MTVVQVPTVGRIVVKEFARRVINSDGVSDRWYHRVTLDGSKFGTGTWDSFIGQSTSPVPVTGASFVLYDTVHAAVSFAEIEGFDIDPWVGSLEIPVGYADLYRSAYHVISDGHDSWATDGTTRHKRVKVTRYYDEPAFDAAWRSLSGWSGWEGAGTFDSIQHGDTWTTVPVEGEPERRHGICADVIPRVRHQVTWSGEVTRWLPDMARQAQREGRAWK